MFDAIPTVPPLQRPHGEAAAQLGPGGLTGGGRLSFLRELGEGVRAVAITRAAVRAYRSVSGCARVEVRLAVGRGGARGSGAGRCRPAGAWAGPEATHTAREGQAAREPRRDGGGGRTIGGGATVAAGFARVVAG